MSASADRAAELSHTALQERIIQLSAELTEALAINEQLMARIAELERAAGHEVISLTPQGEAVAQPPTGPRQDCAYCRRKGIKDTMFFAFGSWTCSNCGRYYRPAFPPQVTP